MKAYVLVNSQTMETADVVEMMRKAQGVVESMSQPIHLFDSDDPQERVGAYVCHCGTNIAGTVDVEEVRDLAGQRLKDRGVVVSPIERAGAPVRMSPANGNSVTLR